MVRATTGPVLDTVRQSLERIASAADGAGKLPCFFGSRAKSKAQKKV
jgi:hypothetical protein